MESYMKLKQLLDGWDRKKQDVTAQIKVLQGELNKLELDKANAETKGNLDEIMQVGRDITNVSSDIDSLTNFLKKLKATPPFTFEDIKEAWKNDLPAITKTSNEAEMKLKTLLDACKDALQVYQEAIAADRSKNELWKELARKIKVEDMALLYEFNQPSDKSENYINKLVH